MKDTFITFGIFYRHLEKMNCLQGYSWDLSMGEGRSHPYYFCKRHVIIQAVFY